VLTFATVGFPSLLLMAGAWSFSAVANRRLSALSGVASWAVGAIVEVGFLGAESAAMAIAYPHFQPQFVYVAMLAIPLLVALAIMRLPSPNAPRSSGRMAQRASAEPWLALIGIILIELMFEMIKLHGNDYGITWAMNGDARNNVAFDRNILSVGGVTLQAMKSYPALINAVTAILDGAGGRSHLTTAALMIRDVQAMVSVFIMSTIAIALFFMAAASEAFPRRDDEERLPFALIVPLGACGSVAVGAWVLGLGLAGGFLSAMGCLSLTGSAIVLGMRLARAYSNIALIILTVDLVMVLASWTFLLVVPAVALLLGYWRGVRYFRELRREGGGAREIMATRGALISSVVGLVVVLVILLANGSVLMSQLKAPGGIIPTGPWLFVLVGFTIMVAVVVAPNKRQRSVRMVSLSIYVACAALVTWIWSLHPGGVDWSYYATKTVWLVTATLLWCPFVLLVDIVRVVNRANAGVSTRAVSSAVLSIVGSSGLLWGIGHETPFPFPWTWAYVGSTIPSPQEIQLVTRQADIGGPFVIWQISTPYEDQLGNFWSALTWDYNENGTVKSTRGAMTFVAWAGWENGSLSALCTAVTDNQMRVVTSNPRLVPTLRLKCPGYRPVPSQAHER
jgi:hypothetical protein